MRITFFAASAAVLFLNACAPEPAKAPSVAVKDAWVRLPAVPGRPGAAYFSLASTTSPARLVSVSSPDVKRIELHDSREEKGMMRMDMLESVPFPKSGELTFEPGSKHAMLFDIAPSVQPGGTIRLTFTFDPAPPVTVDAHVMAAGDAPAHQGH